MTFPSDILLVQGDTTPGSLPTAGKILFYAKSNGIFYSLDSAGTENPIGGATGTVTSVTGSGGTTGLTLAGGPITASGTLTLGGTLALANGGTGATSAQNAMNALAAAVTSGSYLRGNGTNVVMATIQAADVPTLNQSTTGSAATLTTSRAISITGDATWTVNFNGSAAATAALTLANSGVTANTYGSATQVPVFTVDAKGRITGVTNTSLTANGTVTSVAGSGGATGLSFTGSPVTTSGTLTLAGTLALASGGTGATTQAGAANAVLPTQSSSAGKFLITDGTNASWASSASVEVVVFHYSSGGSGNFVGADVIYSQTSNVTTTITDTTNCIATYAFANKPNPPKSIMTYGQNFTSNVFNIKDTTSLPSTSNSVVGGGTAAAPDLANAIFTASNVVTLQTRMGDVGASSTVGNRAWLVVVFGF